MVRSNESSTPLSREARWRRGDSMDTKSKSGLRATQSLTTEKMVSGTKPTRRRGKNGVAVGLMVRPRLRDGSQNANVGQLGGAGGRGGARRRGRMSMMQGGECEAAWEEIWFRPPTYPTPSSFRHPVSFTPFVTYHSLCRPPTYPTPSSFRHPGFISPPFVIAHHAFLRHPRFISRSSFPCLLAPVCHPSLNSDLIGPTVRRPQDIPPFLSWLCATRHLLSGQTLCHPETALGLCVHRVAPLPPRFARQWG